MKSSVFFKFSYISFFFLSASMFAQKDQDLIEKATKELKKAIPEESVKIEKEYDEDGNLTSYNSVRELYYSSIEGEDEKTDDMIAKMREMMKEENLRKNSFFESLFDGNEALKENLKKDDFFEGFYKKNFKDMEKMFKKLDTLKNNYFDEEEEEKKDGESKEL